MAFGNQGYNNGGLHRPLADINVTPLVDVMLVLLIVFMITAPMLAQGLKVDLPQAKATQTINPKDPVVLSITREGKVAIGTDEMEIADMIPALSAKMEGDNKRLIQLRADREANYGAIVTVIDELATNGMVHIALISDKPKGGAAKAAAAATGGASIAAGADAAGVTTLARAATAQ